ncbi:[acyl-carrier-protein] S-malonyltransferase [Streptohalobacillus salinus]|uniref:Malonyl CoA-acyl carrier protein transacylase n=1 Tax=Streptohalobacillus salinus TaxID=621096 RepID=A0A2V3WUC6_9BACI|nr:ACP S-malonyltransferase [Streptohalobacillus salinus]PXW92562.1 [acyl-carrier-protein] S-malonyltransferase [Streptohalobacillus salinus]
MKKIVFMFPGQGSQAVGMGQSFYHSNDEIKQIFTEADDLLDLPLSDIMLNGPQEALTATDIAQPALVLLSSAIDQLLKAEGIKPHAVLGHSLGEYSALVSSGVLSRNDALRLVRTRGQLMKDADPEGKGGMAAVLGLDETTIQSVIDEDKKQVEVANLNCPGQIVISGVKADIDALIAPLKAKGAKRVLPLDVSGPFHSSFMRPVATAFKKVLDDATFHTPGPTVYANVTAAPIQSVSAIKQRLEEQLYHKVRFEESITALIDEGVDAFVEVGNKKVLSGLVKKINRRQTIFAIEDTESFTTFIDWYREGGE